MHDVFRPSVGPGRGLQPWSTSRRGLDSGAEREIVTPLGGLRRTEERSRGQTIMT